VIRRDSQPIVEIDNQISSFDASGATQLSWVDSRGALVRLMSSKGSATTRTTTVARPGSFGRYRTAMAG
jgi:hypothetical protein